eukprot:scaffold4050_cov18-Tisochrysis_lutea.AAC.3
MRKRQGCRRPGVSRKYRASFLFVSVGSLQRLSYTVSNTEGVNEEDSEGQKKPGSPSIENLDEDDWHDLLDVENLLEAYFTIADSTQTTLAGIDWDRPVESFPAGWRAHVTHLTYKVLLNDSAPLPEVSSCSGLSNRQQLQEHELTWLCFIVKESWGKIRPLFALMHIAQIRPHCVVVYGGNLLNVASKLLAALGCGRHLGGEFGAARFHHS